MLYINVFTNPWKSFLLYYGIIFQNTDFQDYIQILKNLFC